MKKMLLLLIILPLFSVGQTSEINNQRNLMLGVRFSPDLSSAIVTDALFPDNSSLSFGFTTGLTALLPLSEAVILESGIYYARKTYKETDIKLTDIHGNLIDVAWYKSDFNYLDIPLKLNINVLQSDVNMFISFGGSAGFPLSNSSRQKIKLDDGTEEIHEENGPDLEKMNFSAIIGIGIDYVVSPKFTLRAEPVYRQSLTSAIESDTRYYLYSSGLNLAVLYRI